MMRLPVLPTIVVGTAIALMLALGLWQLDRRQEKAVALAQLAANIDRPVIVFPDPPVGDAMLFRRAILRCVRATGWRAQSGRDAAGTPGWRQLATCFTRRGGPEVTVQFGVSGDPNARPDFAGGDLHGYISHAPGNRSILADVLAPQPKPLMLVADVPLPGLRGNPPPDLSAVPNNHLAYAVQWFLFAGLAAVIYVLALRRRSGVRAPDVAGTGSAR